MLYDYQSTRCLIGFAVDVLSGRSCSILSVDVSEDRDADLGEDSSKMDGESETEFSIEFNSKSVSSTDNGTFSTSPLLPYNGSDCQILNFEISPYDHLENIPFSTTGKWKYLVYWKIVYDNTEPAIKSTK